MSELSKDSISIKSPAKINLHLEVIGKREDGYHELAMVMQNIDLSDYLKFNLNQNSQIRLRSDCHNLSLGSDNLIIKSANLLKKFSNKDLGADIFLSKKIPIGAGLAGGSSNAAATLIGLNKLWDLKFDYNKIFSLSKEIGSDVPFFINGGKQLCFGRGEILESCKSNDEYGILLLKNPNVSISTSDIFEKYFLKFHDKYDMSIGFIEKTRNNLRKKIINRFNFENDSVKLKNDLQLIVEKENDSVNQALCLLSKLKNCLTFSMSGSGPTCFAIFENVDVANQALYDNKELFENNGFNSWVCKLLDKGISFI